jgi:hypothetical protein
VTVVSVCDLASSDALPTHCIPLRVATTILPVGSYPTKDAGNDRAVRERYCLHHGAEWRHDESFPVVADKSGLVRKPGRDRGLPRSRAGRNHPVEADNVGRKHVAGHGVSEIARRLAGRR